MKSVTSDFELETGLCGIVVVKGQTLIHSLILALYGSDVQLDAVRIVQDASVAQVTLAVLQPRDRWPVIGEIYCKNFIST